MVQASVIVSGGTLPYNYLWSDGQITQTALGLTAGTYNCTVTDANNCPSINTSIVITSPLLLTTTSSATDVSCYGGNDGTATVVPTGGTNPYLYLWSDGQTAQTATGLTAGSYTCTVTDDNGCIVVQSITITEPLELTLSYLKLIIYVLEIQAEVLLLTSLEELLVPHLEIQIIF